MRNDLQKIIKPAGPSPTIGNTALRLFHAPVRQRTDFYDTAGRLHGLITLVPLVYGLLQTHRNIPLQPWYWWFVVATLGFAIFARRAPLLRISSNGISFPEKKSQIYPWDQMCEAHARTDELDILMSDGQHIRIAYRGMRRSDIERVKKLVRQQFKVLAERAQREQPMAQAA